MGKRPLYQELLRRVKELEQELSERAPLDENLAWLASFPERNPILITEADRHGRICYLNPAARRAFPDLEAKGTRHPWFADLAFVPPAKDGTFVREVTINTSHYQQTVFYLPDVQRLRVYGLDMTLLRQAQQALQVANRQLLDIIEFLPDGTFVIDQHRKVIAWNRAMEEMTGVEKTEILGQGNHAYAVPLYGKRRPVLVDLVLDRSLEIDHTYDSVNRRGNVISAETYVPMVYGGKGAYIQATASPLFDPSGNIIGAIESLRDITERKKADEALRESEERFRATFEQAAVGMAYISPDFRYLRVNRKLCDIVGYTEEELMHKSFLEITHPDDRETNVCMHHDMVAGGHDTCRLEKRYLHKDGSIIWVNVTVAFLRNDAGELKYCLTVVEDITERKHAEQERARLEAQLFQAQKMEAIGTLAGGIAHDFNNLLMGIQGRASLMMLSTSPEHPHFEHLVGIEEIVEKAAGLTRQLLGFARGGKYEVKPTDLNELVDKSVEMFGRTKKEITIVRTYAEGIWPVEVDRGQIEQVLLNLYVNAWQAMPRGGTLSLQTENVTLDEAYAAPFEVAAGRYVRVTVTDTGVGMDEDTKRRIFEPFFTTKEMGRGTGLGLASAYGIVKNHEGFIEVHSERGRGTSVAVYLPASLAAAQDAHEAPPECMRGTETILLVDDEPAVLEVGTRMLEALGYQVLPAHGGAEAVRVYRTHRSQVDLVILDMIMPQMGGEDALAQLFAINPEVKVLLASGYSLESRIDEILKGKASGFIQKPFDLRVLSQKVRQVLDRTT